MVKSRSRGLLQRWEQFWRRAPQRWEAAEAGRHPGVPVRDYCTAWRPGSLSHESVAFAPSESGPSGLCPGVVLFHQKGGESKAISRTTSLTALLQPPSDFQWQAGDFSICLQLYTDTEIKQLS